MNIFYNNLLIESKIIHLSTRYILVIMALVAYNNHYSILFLYMSFAFMGPRYVFASVYIDHRPKKISHFFYLQNFFKKNLCTI